MGWSRGWFLVAILAPIVAVVGALTLIDARDPAVAAQQDRAAALEGQVIEARAAAELQAQRDAARLMAREPKLLAVLGEVDPDMPPHVRQSVLDTALTEVGEPYPRLGLVLVDGQGARLATTVREASLVEAALARPEPRAAIAEQRLKLAELGGADPRTLIATPIPGPNGTVGALLVLAQPPAGEIDRAHAEAEAASKLVVFVGDAPIGLESAEIRAAIAKAAAPLGGSRLGPQGTLSLGGHTWHTRRFAVPAAPGVHFALAWPMDAPTTFDAVTSPAEVLERAANAGPWLGVALGAGALLWLIGVVIGRIEVKRSVGRLVSDLTTAGAGETMDRGALPAWLRPAAVAAAEAIDEARRAARKASASAAPSPGPSPAPAAPRSAPASTKPAPRPSAPLLAPPTPAPTAPDAMESEPGGDGGGSAASEAGLQSVDRGGEEPRVSAFDLSNSLFDMQLPTLDEDDGDEPDENTDGDIRLPGSSPPKDSSPGGGLLDQLRSTGALEPTARGGRTERTAVRPVPLDLLASSREHDADSDRTAVGPPPSRPAVDALEGYYRQVFDEFVATKEACDEPVEGVDYKRFRAKLVRTRKSLLDRFECVEVRFRVYVRDGKAALKAAPVLEDDDEGEG